MPPEDEAQKVWTSMGLNPQVFPIFYPMGEQPFTDGQGNPSGANGATARLDRPLSNFPHMFMGLRINNVWEAFDPEVEPGADLVQLYRTIKEWTDAEQTVQITLAQQNVTADLLYQPQLTGHDGINWHPFPAPFPMAGGNDITVTIRRVTSYPLFNGEPIEPRVRVSILAAVLRPSPQTMPPMRARP